MDGRINTLNEPYPHRRQAGMSTKQQQQPVQAQQSLVSYLIIVIKGSSNKGGVTAACNVFLKRPIIAATAGRDGHVAWPGP